MTRASCCGSFAAPTRPTRPRASARATCFAPSSRRTCSCSTTSAPRSRRSGWTRRSTSRQRPIQRAPAHDLHVELRHHRRPDGSGLAARARRPAHVLAAARDVRVPPSRRRRLPRAAGQRWRRRPQGALEVRRRRRRRRPAACPAARPVSFGRACPMVSRTSSGREAKLGPEERCEGGRRKEGTLRGSLPLERMLGLYVHIPFCAAICNYCNFNRGLSTRRSRTRYVAALVEEIRRAADGAPADTIYFGGGTPSLLEPAEIGRVIEACRAVVRVTRDAEVTLELNPETVTADRLDGFLASRRQSSQHRRPIVPGRGTAAAGTGARRRRRRSRRCAWHGTPASTTSVST